MKISELVAILEGIRKRDGDLKVVVQTISHYFPPEPVKKTQGAPYEPYVLLNP